MSKQLAHVVNSDLPGGCWRDTSYLEVSVVYLLSNIGKYMRAQCLLTKRLLLLYPVFYQGFIDSTGTEIWQIFSRMFVMAKKILKSCLLLIEIE